MVNFNCINKRIIENELHKKLDIMCQIIGIHLSEWDLDDTLYYALRLSPNLNKIERWCNEYDALIDVAQLLQLKLEPKYYWFTKINKK
jgi:hypothetical protein